MFTVTMRLPWFWIFERNYHVKCASWVDACRVVDHVEAYGFHAVIARD